MPKTLRFAELKQDLAGLLVGAGVGVDDATRLAIAQARALFRKHRGDRTYWAIEPSAHRGMDEARRREIFQDWFQHGEPGRQGDGVLISYAISITTLQKIIREGRKKKWGAAL